MGIRKWAAEYWGKKASGIIYVCNEDRTVLLLKRSWQVEQPGTWGIPGGAVGEGFHESEHEEEDPEEDVFLESAERETQEELGSLPKTIGSLGTTVFSDGGFTYKTFIFDISLEEKNAFRPVLNWENDAWEWFPLDALPGDLHFGVEFSVANAPDVFGSSEEGPGDVPEPDAPPPDAPGAGADFQAEACFRAAFVVLAQKKKN
jgi:8-oxo-dGTP pyrophosphatase MutT (NUDIX family)